MDESLNVVISSKNQKKNARKRQKKKEKKESGVAFEIEEVIEGVQKATLETPDVLSTTPSPVETTPVPMETTPITMETTPSEDIKVVRNLRKKLKQIEELERKIESGELIKPDKGQLDKISRKTEIIKEINRLTS